MANSEQLPPYSEKQPIELASRFEQLCDEHRRTQDSTAVDKVRKQLTSLVMNHAKGSPVVQKCFERDLPRYGNNPGQTDIFALADLVGIDATKEEFGIFTPDGAKQFELDQLTRLIPSELNAAKNNGYSSSFALKNLHDSLVEDYTTFYEEPLPQPATEVVIFQSLQKRGNYR